MPASELNSETLTTEASASEGGGGIEAPNGDSETERFDILGENGEVLMRNNRLTIDDPSRQALTLAEIEELKSAGKDSGKDVIAKIMAAHSALGEKTTFSLAKYTLRKSRKYLKRFQVLPMDIGLVTEYITEKDGSKIMDLRADILGLMCSWANVHHVGNDNHSEEPHRKTANRMLVVDDAGGLVVAALAERMGILHHTKSSKDVKTQATENDTEPQEDVVTLSETEPRDQSMNAIAEDQDIKMEESDADQPQISNNHTPKATKPRNNPRESYQRATRNTITLIHPATQPNLAMLKYFGYALEDTHPAHPLFSTLKFLTWLQFMHPEEDAIYAEEPELVSDDVLSSMKSGKRGQYYRKVRRWQRVKAIVEETKAGGFDALVIASYMEPAAVLRQLVPLVKGGGQIVVYSPNVEPLTHIMDLYSRERRTAYLNLYRDKQDQLREAGQTEEGNIMEDEEDFPVNPSLILNPMLQTARAVDWQVLPGRTHPLMTSKGGPEGYVFSATRVIPYEGPVNARGKFQKKRKDVNVVDGQTNVEQPISKKSRKGTTAEAARKPAL